MSEDLRPLGRRYTQVYLADTATEQASQVLRNRLGEYFWRSFERQADDVLSYLLTELGCDMPGATARSRVRDFLKKSALNDLLDSITLIADVLDEYDIHENRRGDARFAVQWIGFADRAFEETGSQFTLDEKGGVHPRVDPVFQSLKQEVLKGIDEPRHSAVRAHFDEAFAALDEVPPAGGRAIREMHLAVESAFRQAFPKASRIDVKEIDTHLKSALAETLNGPELNASKLMLTAAGNFITAGHQYRHAPGSPEPTPPSLELTVWMLSQGAAFLRWLIAFGEERLRRSA